MLAGVLLHVVEAAAPIDGAFDGFGFYRARQLVSDAFVFVGNFEHRNPADGPNVKRLPAGRGIEGGSIQIDGAAVIGASGGT